MNNTLNQPEPDDTQIKNPFPIIDGPLSNQEPEPSPDRQHEEFKEYEEPHVPYLPLPSDSPQQPAWRTSPTPAADSQAADTPSSSSPGDTTVTPLTSEGGAGVFVLVGAILGAILGGVASHASGGSLVVGVVVGLIIGAVIGVIALIQFDAWGNALGGAWEALEGLALFDDCCLTSVVLVVASVLMIGGFLLWHSLLLAALAGGSIMTMILIGWSFALLNQFLAKRRVFLSDHARLR